MRRAPLLALLALPVIVIAAVSAGNGQVVEVDNFEVTTGASYINKAQCEGADLHLEWNIVPLSAAFDGTGTYEIWASNTEPPRTSTDTSANNFCPVRNEDENVFTARVTGFDADTAVQSGFVPGDDVVTAADDDAVSDCGASGENKVVWVCTHWLDTGSTKRGYASGKFIIQVKPPAVPVIVDVGSGDSRLEVSWDPGAIGTLNVEADSYVASAATIAGGRAVATATTDAESVTIRGLTNFTTYSVTVQAVSVGGNLSDPSFAVSGTPSPSAGFWDVYKDRGGVEQGGCATGSAGVLALLATASLLAIRRRKP